MKTFEIFGWQNQIENLCRRILLASVWLLVACKVQAQTNFSTAQVISGNWGSVTNNDTGVIPDVGAPNTAGFPAHAPVWYQWTAPADGDVQMDTYGSMGSVTNFSAFNGQLVTNVSITSLDTVLGVYAGSGLTSLYQVSANDDLYAYSSMQENESGQNIYATNIPNIYNGTNGPYASSSSYFYTQPYGGPSGLHFHATQGTTYYIVVDTKTFPGSLVLNWAYHSSGIFRLASENIDRSITDTNGNPMLLYEASETEASRRLNGGSINAAQNSTTYKTYYEYDVPGVLVTVTRLGGYSGRVTVDYTTVDGDTNMLVNGDLPAVAGVDYGYLSYESLDGTLSESGTLTFSDFEMSKTLFIPIYDDGGVSQPNRDFTVVLSNPQLDPSEDAVNVSPPRLDPTYNQALVRILDTDIDPRGESQIQVVQTNGTAVTTNIVYTPIPTNAVFNFMKSHFQVARDDTNYWKGTPITVYVTRSGTNTGSSTVYWSVNNYFLDKETGDDNRNIYFPLQAASDYATPDPAVAAGVYGTNSDFNFPGGYSGSLTFPGGTDHNPQPIQFTVYNNKLTQFNKDFHISLYELDSNGNPYQPGMVAETTVTILFNDSNAPAGSVDEYYNTDYGLDMVPAVSTIPLQLAHPGTDGEVYGLSILTNNETIIVGDFFSYNGIGRNCIALINTNGSLDTTFNPGSGANDFINAVAVNAAGQFIIGGAFSSFNGTSRNGIARLNANGSIDTTFLNGLAGADGVIYAIALQPNGQILVAGDFTHINGTPCNYIARLNVDGSLDGTFNPGTLINGPVYALAFSSSGTGQVFVGGSFTVSGQRYGNIASLNSDGSLNTTFDTGTGADNTVNALCVQPTGQLLVGGAFANINGTSLSGFARLNSDGTIDTTGFFPGTGADGIVDSILYTTNYASSTYVTTNSTTSVVTTNTYTTIVGNSIYIGGNFTVYNGTHRLGFARLFLDGTVDTSFLDTAYNQFAGLPRIYFGDSPGAVYASGIQADGNLMIAGSFDQVGGGQFDVMIGSNSIPQNYDPNVWPEPKVRDGIRNRNNVARLIGGSTPGPGNIGLLANSYSVNKSQQFLYAALFRTNGSLGMLSANFSVLPGTAQGSADYVYNSINPLYWIGWQYVGPSRMHSDGLFGLNGFESDIYGTSWSGGVATLSQVIVTVFNNILNQGNLSATFQLSSPSTADQFYLGGQNIPLAGALGMSSAPLTIIDDQKQSGTLGFSASTFIASGTNAQISLVRSNGTYGIVTMKYSTADATAVSPGDYTPLSNQTISFGNGVVSNGFNVTIKNNGFIYTNIVEKTLTLKLSNLAGPSGSTPSYGISNAVLRLINPNYQGYITLSATNYSGKESSGVISFIVNRISGSYGAVSVQYATADGSALNRVDYFGATNTLTWTNGDVSPRIINIPLTNSLVVGSNKQFTVSLSNPKNNGVLTPGLMAGAITNATLTIVNDNSYGALQLSSSVYNVNEDGGSATITVIRTGAADGSVSVNFSTADGPNAVSGINYIPTNGVLNFAPNQTSASFSVPVLDDGVVDAPNFYFNVNLSNAVNATLVNPSNAVVSILDAQSYIRPPGDPGTGTNAIVGANGAVLALALQTNGQILVGGNFTAVNSIPLNYITRLNADGTLDTTFMNGLAGANSEVLAIVSQSNARTLVGGAFTSLNGVFLNHVARLMTDGTLDSSFNPGSGADGNVDALAETFIGGVRKLYVGGFFGHYNSTYSPGIIRLNDNGSVDNTFVTGTGADGAILAIAVYPTNSIYAGKVLIAGNFTHYNGTNYNYMVRLNSNGTVDNTFNASIGGSVSALAIQPDSSIVIGGSFIQVNGSSANRIARLNADGTLDANFALKVGTGIDNTVNSIVLQPDNRILVAGAFTQVNGNNMNRIARLLASGALDTSIDFGNGANGNVDSMALQPNDGMIIIGGDFTQFNNQSCDHLTRLYGGSGGSAILSAGSGLIVPAGSAIVQESYAPANDTIDPGEQVTLAFAFRDSAGNNVTNLVATLLATNGITYPSGPQAYAPLIVSGPSASCQFSFTAKGTNGQSIMATFQLQAGTNNLGLATFNYMLGVSTNIFSNTNTITINDDTNASPYPSIINVSGVGGSLTKATATFKGLTHSWPADIDALLVSPLQQNSLLMANAGNGYAANNVTLTFDDAASAYLPQNSQITSGTVKPTAYFPVITFPLPAVSPPYTTNLSTFIGGNPNGAWSLFVLDDSPLNTGVIANGWALNLISSTPVGKATDLAVILSPSPISIAVSNALTYVIAVTNYGPSDASGVSVTNVLPSNVNIVSITGTQGTFVQSGSMLAWNVGSLALNAGAQLVITVKPTSIGFISSTATVYSTTTDPNPDDNVAMALVNVTSAAPVISGSMYSTSNGTFMLSIGGTSAQTVIQASTNLINWISIYTNTPPYTFSDPNATNYPTRFYRAVLQ